MNIKRYFKFFTIHLTSQMEYKASFILSLIGRILVATVNFLSAYFLVSSFSNSTVFTKEEMLICFSVIMVGISLSELFFRGFDSFSEIISNGEYDRILLRPQNEIVQIMENRMDFARLGAIVQAILVLIIGLSIVNLEWTKLKIILLLFMIIGSFIIYSAIYIISGATCFYTTEKIEVFNLLSDGTKNFGAYPFSIFGKFILKFLTFVVPLAFVQVYPLQYIIGKSNDKMLIFYPFVSIPFFIFAIAFFKITSKRYKSIGA